MKKFIVFSAACAFLATSCLTEKPENSAIDQPGAITFEIQTTTASDGVTRASDFYSEEVNLQVTDVKLYAFKLDEVSGNYLYTATISIPWSSGKTFDRYTLDEGEKLEAGSYRFLVIGRNSTSDGYTLTDPQPTTRIEDMAVTIVNPGDESDIYVNPATTVREITEDGGRVVITIKRKVAGILCYFANVPQMIGEDEVRTLRLEASTANTSLNLLTSAGSVASGSKYNVIDIDLTTQTVTGDGIYEGNDVGAEIVKLPNTQLGGTFIIPVSATLSLNLYGEDPSTPLKTWSVTNGGSTTVPLVSNNLYSLGKKVMAGNTDGGTNDDDTDDDTPLDLMTDQSLAITISPNWEPINYLTIN